MSTTIETAGGTVGVACSPADALRPVLLTLHLHNGAGMTLRLTPEEARQVAVELLARAGVTCSIPPVRRLPPLPPGEVLSAGFDGQPEVLGRMLGAPQAQELPRPDIDGSPCARCGCLATSHPVPRDVHATPGSVAWCGCVEWQLTNPEPPAHGG